MNKYLFFCALFLVVVVFGMGTDVFAQTPPMFPDPPNQTPIDGGLTAVALGVGAWAVNRLRKAKK